MPCQTKTYISNCKVLQLTAGIWKGDRLIFDFGLFYAILLLPPKLLFVRYVSVFVSGPILRNACHKEPIWFVETPIFHRLFPYGRQCPRSNSPPYPHIRKGRAREWERGIQLEILLLQSVKRTNTWLCSCFDGLTYMTFIFWWTFSTLVNN